MPMQMRHCIAQAGKIDFVRLYYQPYRGFDSEYRSHELQAFRGSKIRHFLDMTVQDHTAETAILRVVYQYHTTKIILPKQFTARCVA